MAISTHHLAEFLSSGVSDSGTCTIVIVMAKVTEQLKDSGRQSIVIVDTAMWFVDPLFAAFGVCNFAIVASGSSGLPDRGQCTFVIVMSGVHSPVEAGRTTFIIFSEGHMAVGYMNVRQDKEQNVTIQ